MSFSCCFFVLWTTWRLFASVQVHHNTKHPCKMMQTWYGSIHLYFLVYSWCIVGVLFWRCKLIQLYQTWCIPIQALYKQYNCIKISALVVVGRLVCLSVGFVWNDQTRVNMRSFTCLKWPKQPQPIFHVLADVFLEAKFQSFPRFLAASISVLNGCTICAVLRCSFRLFLDFLQMKSATAEVGNRLAVFLAPAPALRLHHYYWISNKIQLNIEKLVIGNLDRKLCVQFLAVKSYSFNYLFVKFCNCFVLHG